MRIAVHLDRGNGRARFEQRERERSEAGADLDDPIAGADFGEAGDAAHGVGVADEVLPERPARRESVQLKQGADLGVAVRHRPVPATR